MTPTADTTLRQLNEQVAAFLRQGRFAQALPLATRACEEVRRRAGDRSPELASSQSRLAEIHRELGQLSEAEQWCFEALEIRGAAGKYGPEYATSLNDLARLYEAQGNNRQAEEFYRGALEIRRATRGERHPEYAQTLHDLGALYDLLGRRPE